MLLSRKNNRYILAATFPILLFCLVSCTTIRPASTKSGKHLIQTFFVGDEGTQYYIKPLSFKNEASEDLTMDLTFRYKNEIKDSVSINFTIKSKNIIKKVDLFSLKNQQYNIKTTDVNLLFNSKDKGNFISRFSTKMPLNDVYKLFNAGWEVEVQHEKGTNTYTPTSQTSKSILKLNDLIFSIF